MAIISFEHRFIFVKTAKTAGTSIEVDLSGRVEEGAIVTPILPPVPGHRARNFADAAGKALYYNHMPASEIRNRLGADVYGGMLSFCVEREPVEKCISHFHMLRNSPLHNPDGAYRHSWAEYVAEGRFPIDTGKYSAPGATGRRLIVDRVLRYDRLATDLATLLDGLGLPGFRLMARAKSDYSVNRLIAPTEVTAADRARIYDAFGETIALTGIDWDRP